MRQFSAMVDPEVDFRCAVGLDSAFLRTVALLPVSVNRPSRRSHEMRQSSWRVSGEEEIPALTISTPAHPGHEGRAHRRGGPSPLRLVAPGRQRPSRLLLSARSPKEVGGRAYVSAFAPPERKCD